MTIVNYQSTRRTQGLYKLYGLYKLSTDLIEPFFSENPGAAPTNPGFSKVKTKY